MINAIVCNSVSMCAVLVTGLFTQSVTYEGNTLPDRANPPWERLGTFDAERWVEDGCFYQFCEIGMWAPPPFGEIDYYRRTIGEFSGVPQFFVAWRVHTSVPAPELIGSVTVVSVAGSGPAVYHFTLSNSRIRFIRDNPGTFEFYYDITPDVPHSYFLHITGSNYTWYVDGAVAHQGVAIGDYPYDTSRLLFSSRFYTVDNLTRWDYVRYGVVPQDASGDFDSDADTDTDDAYFFVDCLLGPDAAGPGCRWADMNADGVVNGLDIAAFASLLAGA